MQVALYIILGCLLQGAGYFLMTLGHVLTNLLGGFSVALGLAAVFHGGSISSEHSTRQLIRTMRQNNAMLEKRAEEMLSVVEILKGQGQSQEQEEKVIELESDLHDWINALLKNK